MKNRKFNILIPARGGSKGVPNKNIKIFNGKPLLCWSIDSSKQIGNYRIIVSSDSEDILNITKKYDNDIELHKRLPQYSSDESTSLSLVSNLLDENIIQDDEHLILFEPTSPFRSTELIKNSINYYNDNNILSMVSVGKVDEVICGIKDHRIMIDKNNLLLRRQDRQEKFQINGNFYVNSINHLLKNGFLNENTFAIPVNKIEALEINDKEDYEILSNLAKSYWKNQSA
ncbi:acylneuraminate cytidylyltransferase family protein [Amylibacter sp.]|jgi:CMP-N-acetylneuraminic acid synthetase|nr:acylneuraminate cytidylyltransferase family protein [Amylibacter sp.]